MTMAILVCLFIIGALTILRDKNIIHDFQLKFQDRKK